ncbi:MAG TPA: NADP oxidoreductase [Cyanobacteria bacterium UBA11049]|nr:NADP oxidoreductase [Cyanobacteria bacterium UBA11049]
MKIGIVNAGNIGRALAKPWHRAGHQLLLAKDGNPTKLDEFVQVVDGALRGTPRQAADFGEVVLFSVYWPRLDATLTEVGDLAGKIVIDTMNPLNVNDRFEHYHDLEFMQSSSTSEELQKRLPDARIVKAFSTLPAQMLNADQWSHNLVTPTVFVAGDDPSAKNVVFQLVQDAGFQPLDVGPLLNARSIEQLGVLLHHVGTYQFGGHYERLAPTVLQALNPGSATV